MGVLRPHACHLSGLSSTRRPWTGYSRTSAQQAAAAAELIRTSWSFGDPAASERRFGELSAQAVQRGEHTLALELQTQVARAQGLSRRFEDAAATLTGIESQLPGQPARVRVR
ncbi:MAG TPA: hypothetical protein VI197_04570, partial [Polyangiaceae bacterium]